MAYQTYITEALVCGSRPSHTSDRAYLLFTREAGMLYATAKSVREERSKQRFALQEFSYIRATLVHGKAGWRIAGVEALVNLYSEASGRNERATVRDTLLLLRRVLQGETRHSELFDDVVAGLRSQEHLTPEDRSTILSTRVLHALGYVAPEHEIAHFLGQTQWDFAPLTEEERAQLLSKVESALVESQL